MLWTALCASGQRGGNFRDFPGGRASPLTICDLRLTSERRRRRAGSGTYGVVQVRVTVERIAGAQGKPPSLRRGDPHDTVVGLFPVYSVTQGRELLNDAEECPAEVLSSVNARAGQGHNGIGIDIAGPIVDNARPPHEWRHGVAIGPCGPDRPAKPQAGNMKGYE